MGVGPTRSGGAGFHVPGWVAFRLGGSGCRWSGWCREGSESGESGGDQLDPGCSRCQLELGSAGVAADAAGDGEQSQPEAFGFPPPRGVIVQRERLGPGDQVAGELHDRAPDLVLVEPVEWKILQSGIFRGADAVLAAGASAVAQLQVGELSAAGVGDERGSRNPSWSVNRS